MATTKVDVNLIGATGTPGSGNFLRGDGTWNTPAGGLVLIGTATASGSASLTITGIDATYESYKIIGSNLTPVTDNVEMWMTLGDSSGLDTGSTDYQGTVLGVYVGSTSSNVYTTYQGAAYINMSGSNSEMIGNSTGEGISF